MRRRRRLLAAVSLVVLAGCGGSKTAVPAESGSATALPTWVEARLAQKDGDDLTVIFGTADHGVGANRVSFVVVRPDGSIVQVPWAEIRFAPADAPSRARAKATLVPLGPHAHPEGSKPHDHQDATDLYVASVRFPRPGRYWFVVEPDGTSIQAAGALEVARRTVSPAVGSKAIPSHNPTLEDAPAEEITTASPPDTELLRYSIADSLDAGAPFVVAFATPMFCQTRTCGPTVEVVDRVRRRLARTAIRFIHVEIYEENDPQKGTNRWVEEWKLPTEPWVFLVDRRGVIRAKFEGSVSVDELERAVRRHLL